MMTLIEKFKEVKKIFFDAPVLNTDVHFGGINKPLPDWRKKTMPGEDDDNDEDAPIEKDVLAILGFDPDKEKI